MLLDTTIPSEEPARTNYWRTVIVEWKKSGHSIVAFCKINKISKSAFYRWRILLDEDYERKSNKAPTSLSTQSFVPVTISNDEQNLTYISRNSIEIIYPNGCQVKIQPDFDVKALTNINKTMGVVTC